MDSKFIKKKLILVTVILSVLVILLASCYKNNNTDEQKNINDDKSSSETIGKLTILPRDLASTKFYCTNLNKSVFFSKSYPKTCQIA